MQIIGHKLIKFIPLIFINSKNDIKSNDNIIFEYDEEFLEICSNFNKNFSVIVKNIKELLICSNLGANYIVVDKKFAKKAQEMANYYVLDSKIAIFIDNEDEIEEAIELKIDAVIYKSACKNF